MEQANSKGTLSRKALYEQTSRSIPRLVGKATYVLLVAFNPDEFLRVAPPRWLDTFGDSVHAHGVQLAMTLVGDWNKSKVPSQSSRIMERGDEGKGKVARAVDVLMHNDGHQLFAASTFTTVPKGMSRGTEAADFCAWHWNKYYLDKFIKGQKHNLRRFCDLYFT